MKGLPSAVKRALEKLKVRRRRSVVIRRIKRGYYAYESSTTYDRVSHRRKSVSFYIGKIDKEGKFVEAKKRYKQETNVGSLNELMVVRKELEEKGSLDFLVHPSEIDLKILTLLSGNGRLTPSEIGKEIGLGRSVVAKRIKRLEESYDIRYTLDFGKRPFGFFRFCAFVKFYTNIPDANKIREVLSRYPMIQLAAFLKGDYDLFIYFLEEDTKTLEDRFYEIRSDPVFSGYDATWYIGHITYGYGFVNFRDEFFKVLEKKIWHKTKDEPRKKADQILDREYRILRELNKNGRANFNDIDVKNNLPIGSSSYTFHKLMEEEIITRISINISKPQNKYTVIFIAEQINMEAFNANRFRFFEYMISPNNRVVNRFALMGDISFPSGLLFAAPVFEETDIKGIESELNRFSGNCFRIKSFIVTETVLGSFGYNKIDKKYSPQYRIIQDGLKTPGLEVWKVH
jgi:DNA-binding Lrp family transcriptional regulator